MELIPDITERTTAATNLMMAIAACIGLPAIYKRRSQSPLRTSVWVSVYILFIVAALIGAVHHGLTLSVRIYDATWLAILLCLGIMVGLFVVGLIFDLFGRMPAIRALPVMLACSLGFFIYSAAFNQDYGLFLVYQALALLAALTGYGWLATRHRPGALWMSIGVLLTIVAAAVQGTQAISFTLLVPFDHNGIYHLIQIAGVLCLTRGICRATQVSTT